MKSREILRPDCIGTQNDSRSLFLDSNLCGICAGGLRSAYPPCERECHSSFYSNRVIRTISHMSLRGRSPRQSVPIVLRLESNDKTACTPPLDPRPAPGRQSEEPGTNKFVIPYLIRNPGYAGNPDRCNLPGVNTEIAGDSSARLCRDSE